MPRDFDLTRVPPYTPQRRYFYEICLDEILTYIEQWRIKQIVERLYMFLLEIISGAPLKPLRVDSARCRVDSERCSVERTARHKWVKAGGSEKGRPANNNIQLIHIGLYSQNKFCS